MSTPGSNVAFGSPCLPMPRSPVRTPTTRVAVVQAPRCAGEAGEEVDAFGLDQRRQPLDELVERDDVVAVILERRRRDRQPELAAARQEVDVVVVHLGARAARPCASKSGTSSRERRRIEHARPTACARRPRAPSRARRSTSGSPPLSFCSCASRSAADSPAGPPPTIRTSTSRVSRSCARSALLSVLSLTTLTSLTGYFCSSAISAGTISNRSPTMP